MQGRLCKQKSFHLFMHVKHLNSTDKIQIHSRHISAYFSVMREPDVSLV